MKTKTLRDKFERKKQSSKDRGIAFTLTFEEYKRLNTETKCFYTGVEFKPYTEQARSLERIDNSRGYENGNVVACLKRVNSFKDALSEEEIIKIWCAINRHNNISFFAKIQKLIKIWRMI